ncbi:30S ribosomal protein S6e [Sulfodiicoccus acidiphilus]|uniref:Small ribosomal subunit protein eS6 n=1 Tax=Sulfodiicoccus acidiphilus TaxID=1670455 RepID=A0A348B195_9CREN|nr:30S ribosomal protein S6e [Sulfodiicoccus acidiphilus]BBD71947.1 30S ribosomal protein S6e [Sulfodiicoccus acidiphilus]GGT91672.1 30S ribosomal protein S6e [Sulfodiicoccus acidiphilus]
MPDFKVSISDPGTKGGKSLNLKVKSSQKVKPGTGEKEGRTLPIALLNPEVVRQLDLAGFLSLEASGAEGKKVKVHFAVQLDQEVPRDEVWVSDAVAEKLGNQEVKAYRTRAFQLTLDQGKLSQLVGVKLGDEVDGSIFGIQGVKLRLTGGSDVAGFPMRFDVMGPVKRKVLLSGPPGYHPEEEGIRRRKLVRGNTVSTELSQLNMVIVR